MLPVTKIRTGDGVRRNRRVNPLGHYIQGMLRLDYEAVVQKSIILDFKTVDVLL